MTTTTPASETCYRHGSEDYVSCTNRPRWRVTRPWGSGTKSYVACHRHIGWLLSYMTVPGHTVEVTQIGTTS